jgi:hypothetical protein
VDITVSPSRGGVSPMMGIAKAGAIYRQDTGLILVTLIDNERFPTARIHLCGNMGVAFLTGNDRFRDDAIQGWRIRRQRAEDALTEHCSDMVASGIGLSRGFRKPGRLGHV